MMASLDIMQVGLCRTRLAGDRPDLLLSPSVGDVVGLNFVGGGPTIDQGYAVVRRSLPVIRELLEARGVACAARGPGGTDPLPPDIR